MKSTKKYPTNNIQFQTRLMSVTHTLILSQMFKLEKLFLSCTRTYKNNQKIFSFVYVRSFNKCYTNLDKVNTFQ